MFLIDETRHGSTNLVFVYEDPRKVGYSEGHVIENVTLDYDMEAVHSWPDGARAPEACLGQDPKDPLHYKVFKYSSDLQSAGYRPVPGNPVLFGSWKDYVKLHRIPPDPEQTDDELWYEYLDKLDEDSRRRRQRSQAPSSPEGKSRDEVAAWVAKKHLVADDSIREVWYLPSGAPSEEIRLLELNDRLAGNGSRIEAIDFGLDVEGASFRLFVADINSEQLDRIKQDAGWLPPGWLLDAQRIWRRGA